MNNSNQAIPDELIWRHPFILSSGDQPASIDNFRPAESDHTVLDPKTYEAIEAEKLFACINYTRTENGRLCLYRSLARPLPDAQVLQMKQEALREIASNQEICEALERYVEKGIKKEPELKYLLYGEFSGGLTTDVPTERTGKLEFGGFGYHQYREGTQYVVDRVAAAKALPRPESRYLQALFSTLQAFDQTRVYQLMKGPVYMANDKFKTQQEKPKFLPLPRFRPTIFKWIPATIFIAAVYAIILFFEILAPELGASYIGYGILVLTVPVFPILLLAMGASDRDSVIYPLRKQYRQSEDLARFLDSMGMLDELLSFHRYRDSLQEPMTLPKVLDEPHHLLIADNVKNPLLIPDNANYVPNDVVLDTVGRLLIITGPNSGGKTAYCKTIAQIQLLGQIGCYIPATNAQLVPAERIYYQVPDPGQLEAGMGRFGHELKRTREIFFNSTPLSLVVLDELSEGTTFEEKMTLSEYILKGFHQLGASTILVTHNHELCERLQSEGIGRYLQVEFVQGAPTHRMVDGVSRVSHAHRVASEIGFSKADVEKHIKKHLSGDDKQTG
ncbi:MutS-related protein [Nitrosomonas sp.]|uniref:MutS-related protein n=1 Tax=Nitrosomonas sp. TaxID=42353 RepID=UPI00283ABC31|nr:DNA mismatch repair protein MutS [Nitrosomonas sp.]MDR4513209.1 DNA mismatch repair protein MutS [Nitrosomonas sp.]